MKKNLNKKLFSILIINLLIVGGFLFIFEFSSDNTTVEGTILTVNDDGGAMFTTIQSAINAASPGDIIEVWEGTYNENLIINKKLEIKGNDKINTIIDAGGSTHAVQITSDWVNLSGVKVTNGDINGILLDTVSNCSIYDNFCTNTGMGIRVFYSDNNIIDNNTFNSNTVGIWSYSSSGNIITNNTCNFNLKGIYLTSSFNNKIINNSCLNNTDGVRLEVSDKNILEDNNCSMNYGSAISLSSSNSCTIYKNICLNNINGITLSTSSGDYIVNNTLISCGISMYGSQLKFWNTHTIDITNTVNNKPAYYWKNQTGGIIPAGAGQVILANCTNIIVQNQNVDNGSLCIELGFSSNNTINSNSCNSSNVVSIKLYYSSWNYITNNHCSNSNGFGIGVDYSSNNKILNNTCNSNVYNGIRLDETSNSIIDNNTCTSNLYNGIYLDTLSKNIISNNTCNSNSQSGIYLNVASSNTLENNICNFNIYKGIYLTSSLNNYITNCNISTNEGGIHLRSDSNATINYNSLSNNIKYGINNTQPSILVNAINNSWGDPSGPYHPVKNPKGEGDNVSDFIIFEPWLPVLPPILETDDINIIIEDELYKNTYNATDLNKDPISWKYSSNATWLNWFTTNHTLYGMPTNNDVGFYWICVNVTDGKNGYDEHNFTLTVVNKNPSITTEDLITVTEDSYYYNDYNSDDDNQGIITWYVNSNASWLTINNTTGVLNGTPKNEDVGLCWINISVNDGNDGIDFSNFTLTIENQNDVPLITTEDIITINEDEYYEVVYNATEVDIGDILIWTYESKATWLNWGAINHTLYGTPRNEDVGSYWVRINISDGNDGYDEHNLTLTVININNRPIIITEDILIANESELYKVDYNATDVDSPLSQQIWTLETNATWLSINPSTGVLSGTPVFNEIFNDEYIIVAWWTVNVTVSDGDGGSDRHDFILFVFKRQVLENEPPIITTTDVVSATIDELYHVDYDAIDDWTPKDQLTWKLNTDASWLSLNSKTGVLTGTPTSSDIGSYWVNVSVLDTDGAVGSHNFTLTVYSESNLPPDITTQDDINAVVGEKYSVDYEADDDRTSVNYLQWSLATNASWLTIGENTGILSGKPNATDIGWYWVKISVFDGEDGWDYSNFTLYVTTEPITKLRPELSNPKMTPTDGDTNIEFIFSVDYSHPDGDLPDSIQVVIDGNAFDMDSSNGHYEYSTKLSEGTHTYCFTTTLSELTVSTENFTIPYITKAEEGNGGKPGDDDEDNTMLYAGIGIIVIIIVVLILLFIFLKKKKAKEEEGLVEEAQPPPPEEVPPEIPPEQPPTPEIPLQTPPEVQPEPQQLPPQPEIPAQPPQELPTQEVTHQVVPQPQVEEQPQQTEPTLLVKQSETPAQEPILEVQKPEDRLLQQPIVKQEPQVSVPKVVQAEQQSKQSIPQAENSED